MRSPRAVWEGCRDDERWISDPVEMLGEIIAEAFDAGRDSVGSRAQVRDMDGFRAGLEAGARVVELLHERMPCTATFQASGLAAAIRAIDPAKPPGSPTIVRSGYQQVHDAPPDRGSPEARVEVEEPDIPAPQASPAPAPKRTRAEIQARNAEVKRRIDAGEARSVVARELGVTIANTYAIAPTGARRRPRSPTLNQVPDDVDAEGSLL